ncbi:hypothetical protein FRACYDRAFT_258969 [Fragilariopsis cylindrus CCMP1102]|uniref:Uncharacterized protein n=1 Tax=Fragilariopsis cylindrus CCMP1102 TaxID=635003 RepID=A0A1E7FVS4_9STRA|nr:hypothetical protein FRACYDRAFT_258969 [Fragilariopsis cylindrus CCMP1102]|eukprot:OEU22224.1 hypothetical protein FRACYDRAFT_258969 [Fragilariopsis cylindrus CCMP1102]
MVMSIEIENLPEEMGEETMLGNNDDGTICSKIVGCTIDRSFAVKVENEDNQSKAGTEAATEETQSLPSVENKENEKDEDAQIESKSDDTEEKEKDDETEDRDFDKNPTVLYALVQKKLWKETIARAKKSPEEARAFICRREKDGRIRWRLLPLHAAIVFKAPEDVVETLLTAFPKAAEAKDDQGMLPLHLAFRNGASEVAVNLLLLACPQSVDIPDRKNRVPLTLAKAASSPNREIYIKALEKGPAHYSITALSCARARIMTEQDAIFEGKLLKARTFHEYALSEVVTEGEKKQQELEETVAEKETELTKLHETSQVLVDHVTSLEAQINTRSDTERFLATKIAKLEQKLKESERLEDEREQFLATKISKLEEEITENEHLKDEREGNFEDERGEFNKEKENLLAQIDTLQTTLSLTREKLADSICTMVQKEEEWATTKEKLEEKYRETHLEWANAQANCAIFEAQLKKRMENEHLLASQVSTLASRLAECSHELNEGRVISTKRIKELEDDQLSLNETVEDLTARLQNISAVMQNTHKQQMIIVDDAIGNEEIMADCMETHAKMVSESIQQERHLRLAREEMMQLLEQSFGEADEKRHQLMNSITDQGKHFSNMIKTRGSMLSCVQKVTTNVASVLQNDLAGLELRQECDETKIDEAEEEMLTEGEQQQQEIHVESVEEEAEQIKVTDSPKKFALLAEVVAVVEAEEEERTEFDEKRSVLDDRITAE